MILEMYFHNCISLRTVREGGGFQMSNVLNAFLLVLALGQLGLCKIQRTIALLLIYVLFLLLCICYKIICLH